MYKFILNGNVVDVVKNIRYLRYLKKSHHVVGSDKSSANCVQGSNGRDVYGIQGAKLPEYLNYPTVIIKPVDSDEYNRLKQILSNDIVITADSAALQSAQQLKVSELDSECKKVITEGIVVKLSDGRLHSFELTIEDQLNLSTIQNKISKGAESCIYHEKGQLCRLYTAEDLQLVIDRANQHIFYNTTYLNLMKNCIHNMYSIEEIQSIHYGDELPNAEYRVILSQI